MSMNTKRRNTIRQQWMAAYEAELVRQVPALAGKVDWDAAMYFFNTGHSSREAAYRMATRWSDHDAE